MMTNFIFLNMKTINDYILEKFKISSKTVKKGIKEINCDNNHPFSQEEIDKMIKFGNNLDIIPNKVYTTINSFIYYYDRSKFIKGGWHVHNIIKIVDESNGKEKDAFKVAFCCIDQKPYYWYPAIDGYTLEECFDCIKKKWKELKYDKVIRKYLKNEEDK